ncbi:MAG: hypothetical protein K2P76_02370 [Lachnospiraceae bacterium]|nr:hypothetical protein [Lachnospiraceae bacterium]MDE6982861.1 hypothetical protein [Lachnospiraceae bacterium]
MEKENLFVRLKKKFIYLFKIENEEQQKEESEEKKENPYLPYIREILEKVLLEKNVSYRDFFPVLIDGEEPEKTLFTAKELGADLNRMAIFTDRPEYFENYKDMMYEEQGLIIEVFSKGKDNLLALLRRGEGCQVVLDFEKEEHLVSGAFLGEKIYIPIFKKPWERAGNIDIALPIGYNTMIVRGIDFEKKRPVMDKFEQAFYDKE